MSIAFNAFGIILLVSRSCAVLLSVCIGVGGWGWPSSLSVWCMETAVFALMKRAPSSASAANDMTARIICEMLWTAPLFVGMSSLPAINMCLPARLRAFGLISMRHHCVLPEPCRLPCM
jgi:hypothetical protein